MSKQSFRIIPAKQSTQVFILVREEAADEDGVMTVKAGFLEVEPAKANTLLEKLEKGERVVIIGSMRDDGQHNITVAPKVPVPAAGAPAGELKH